MMSLQMPVVSQQDLDQVATMILRLHAPETAGNPDLAHAVQKELLVVFESDQAWGLTEGLLQHPNAVVRFSGAQNAHIKISRFWETLPQELHPVLLQQTLNLTSQAASPDSPYRNENSIVLRKLFSSLASLILRLTPEQWSNPLLQVLTTLAGHRVSRSLIFEWLEIAIRDVQRGALVEPRKSKLSSAMSKEVPLVLGTVVETLTGSGTDSQEVEAAFKCLEAYIEWGLTSEEITNLLPTLIGLLNTPHMAQAISVLVEIMTGSVFKDGKATKITTEPILEWISQRGGAIVKQAAANEDADSEDVVAMTKLVDALVEHSSDWMARRTNDPRVQAFFGVLLDLTGFPGIPGRDENISETTLNLYSTIQESIMDLGEPDSNESLEGQNISKQFFREIVFRIRKKVQWPAETLSPEELVAFEVYRRDAGEVMITAFYVLRDDVLRDVFHVLVDQLKEGSGASWQEVEATLHCIRFVSEAVPLGEETTLPMVFSSDVFSRLPKGEDNRIAMATIRMIRSYEEWFKYHSDHVVLALDYLVTSLDDRSLAPEAALALKSLCDICRGNLTAHVASFGQLHGKVASMGPEEQVRVTEAIASVLQAIPPVEAIEPILTISQPVLDRLEQCVHAVAQAPDAARTIAMQQLETLTACANGLTPSDEDMFDLEPEETASTSRALEMCRQDSRLVRLREGILQTVSKVIEIWGADVEVASAINGFMKASTASPSTITLLSLPIAPLLYLISTAAQRNYLSIWPNTAATLIWRMSPLSGVRQKLAVHLHGAADPMESEEQREKTAKDELDGTVAGTLASLTWATADKLKDSRSMQENPDIAETFFKFASAVISKYPAAFLKTTPENQSACMGMAILALGATEQFTLRGAIEFFVSMLNTSRHAPQALAEAYLPVIQAHGQQILYSSVLGAALQSPRSTIPNYAELMVALVQRVPNETRDWLTAMLRDPGFPGGQADPASKKKFQETMMRARTPKRIREALNDFALVCRGLAGTAYGSATVM